MNILGLAALLCFLLALVISGVVGVVLFITHAAEKQSETRR